MVVIVIVKWLRGEGTSLAFLGIISSGGPWVSDTAV
jgi:hypothetical protein